VLIELIKSLISKIRRLLEAKCVCMSRDEYEQLVREVEEVYKKLEEWMRQAEAGTIGIEVKESH